MNRTAIRSSVAAVAVVAALVGCAGPSATTVDDPPLAFVPGAYLGRAGDSAVFLAVVPGNGSVRVYACDAENLRDATVDQWFEGAFDGTGPATLTAGALTVTVRATATGFAGTLVLPGGAALPFVAAPTPDGSALLDAEIRDPDTGAITRDGTVIVLAGQQRGTFVPTRPPKCRVVLVSTSNGGQQWITMC